MASSHCVGEQAGLENRYSMRMGKQHIHNLPINDITNLSVLAQQVQQEAQGCGETLSPAARLHIGGPSWLCCKNLRRMPEA